MLLINRIDDGGADRSAVVFRVASRPAAALAAQLVDEGRDGARGGKLVPGDEDDAARERRIDQAAPQTAFGLRVGDDVALGHHVGQEGDPHADLDHALDRLDVLGREHRLDGDAQPGEIAGDEGAGGRLWRQSDELYPSEPLGTDRRGTIEGVGATRDERHPLLEEGLVSQPAIDPRIGEDRQVDLVREQGVDDVVGFPIQYRWPRRRVARAHGQEQLGQEVDSDAVYGADADL